MCICRITFLTGASNNHNDSFPFFLSFGGGEGRQHRHGPRRWSATAKQLVEHTRGPYAERFVGECSPLADGAQGTDALGRASARGTGLPCRGGAAAQGLAPKAAAHCAPLGKGTYWS